MLQERDAIALTVNGEARGESIEGRIAVACTLRNRLRSGRWGRSYASVALAPSQFSCWNPGDPNSALLLRLEIATPVSDVVLRECYWIADGILTGAITDRVGAATHYYANTIAAPAWAATGRLVATIGHHLFFENVA